MKYNVTRKVKPLKSFHALPMSHIEKQSRLDFKRLAGALTEGNGVKKKSCAWHADSEVMELDNICPHVTRAGPRNGGSSQASLQGAPEFHLPDTSPTGVGREIVQALVGPS